MKKIIEYNFDKKVAIRLIKKAISGKFAILKDDGDLLKVGAPMMTASIKIEDTIVTVEGSGAGSAIASTCSTEIEMAFEEYKESSSKPTSNEQIASSSTINGPSIQEYFEYQQKGIEIIKSFKELLDSGIITQEEFDSKKEEILNFIKGVIK